MTIRRVAQAKKLTRAKATLVLRSMSSTTVSGSKLTYVATLVELMLLRTSVAFALVSFLAWATLLIVIQLTHLGKQILRGSVVIGIFSIAAGVLLLGYSVDQSGERPLR
ncbi:hypothetical protein KFK09_000124 [Dendrobium nobile]|uniref:Uncharacterized protein n=1 Tax=Dendrobium nobile TaxID=94219 RepID=A0A8T3CDU0_DENNO|nr:hypothetical protein KFK09_000124 [Dendrobium nobile]